MRNDPPFSLSQGASELAVPPGLRGGVNPVLRYTLVRLVASDFLQKTLSPKLLPSKARPQVEASVGPLVHPGLRALLIGALASQFQRPVVWLCQDAPSLFRYQAVLDDVLGPDAVLVYPAEVLDPYDLSTLPSELQAQQHAFIAALNHWAQQAADSRAAKTDPPAPPIVLVNAHALLPKFLDPTVSQGRATVLKADEQVDPDALVQWLQAAGYAPVSVLLEMGEYSRRGDILDIYPVNGPAIRLSFFGDVVESIRELDTDSQRSICKVAEVRIEPKSQLFLTPDRRDALTAQMRQQLTALEKSKTLDAMALEALQATIHNQIQALGEAFWVDGIDYFTPLIDPAEHFVTLGDLLCRWLPADALLVFDDWSVLENQLEGFSDRLNHHYDEATKDGRLLPLPTPWHRTAADTLRDLRAHFSRLLHVDAFGTALADGSDTSLELAFETPPSFHARLHEAVAYMGEQRRAGNQLLVVTDYPQRVLDACKEWDVPASFLALETADRHPEGPGGGQSSPDKALATMLASRDVVICRHGLSDSFVLPDEKLITLTDKELFGRSRVTRHLAQRSPRSGGGGKRQDVERIQSLDQLRPGDFVVHERHGIGQFIEVSRIEMDGEIREYLTVKYAGQDRLHVPVDQLYLLSRYRGAGEVAPRLSRMGGAEWSGTRKKAEKSIRTIARELIRLYSLRHRVRGYAFEMDTPWQVEMEEAFPHEETPDQWQSIQDVKKDMESEKPMDRLICGDVGFGKTEVAMRAIFKAIMSGKQVAVLSPTTILAQQHFNTISDRFKPYPIRVGLLSRFRTAREQKEVVERLNAGEMDVVIGTHRLLQKDVKFKDLGLLVIDEEHRFGVSHKEKIKQLRSMVDVLAMSATPIPRTLYMSLSGVREMSLIKTPPVNRSPVQTFVGPFNPAQIRMAILQELDRGGQVYVVHNRVQSIFAIRDLIQELVPQARCAVAHGQLPEHELENVMLDFSEHTYDVLICTTIIESGVNIPNANTMVITDADRYGLAQLYQLRGRVGRSERHAYCYCYYKPDKVLSEDSRNRLKAIREFNALGSGYEIAMRDMEIRGVGNLLGAEQHGHMVAIGYDLYCQMLKEHIEEESLTPDELAERKPRQERAVIDLNVSAYIPDGWVGGANVKLNEYKRLANVESEHGLTLIEAEWLDRFGGPIPAPTQQLLALARLRILATQAGFPTVRQDEESVRIAVPYELKTWLELQKQLPAQFGKALRWVAPIRNMANNMPTLVYKLGPATKGDELVAFLNQFLQTMLQLINS